MRSFILTASVFLAVTSFDFLSSSGNSFAQRAGEVAAPIPIVFGRKSDRLPEGMRVKGRIKDVSFSRACGGVYWSGTIEIELLKKIPGYPYRKVYVVVNCLEDEENRRDYIDRVVHLEVMKLHLAQNSIRNLESLSRDLEYFYFELIDNTIDSRGVPFYCTTMRGAEIRSSAGE